MMKRKIRVGILCGGKSAEHEVSLQSARNVIEAMDKDKYEVLSIYIDKQGQWFLIDCMEFIQKSSNPNLLQSVKKADNLAIVPGDNTPQLINLSNRKPIKSVDVFFPVLHGPFGEDGTIQGLLKLANVPCVGASILGSAIGMDKDVMKRLMRENSFDLSFYMENRMCSVKN